MVRSTFVPAAGARNPEGESVWVVQRFGWGGRIAANVVLKLFPAGHAQVLPLHFGHEGLVFAGHFVRWFLECGPGCVGLQFRRHTVWGHRTALRMIAEIH